MALVAVGAYGAGIDFNASGNAVGSCGTNASLAQVSGSINVTTPFSESNGATGLKGVGSCLTTFDTGEPSWSTYAIISNEVASGGTFDGLDIPIHWTFTPTIFLGGVGTDGVTPLNYTISFVLNQTALITVSDTTISGTTVSGTQFISPTGTLDSWEFSILVWRDGIDSQVSGTLSLDIPSNSMDINNPDDVAAPEPSTLALLAAGVGLLLLGRSRKQSS